MCKAIWLYGHQGSPSVSTLYLLPELCIWDLKILPKHALQKTGRTNI